LTPGEFSRKRRVLDQMLTGHSLLRDRYKRHALALSLLTLALSIVATSIAFLSGESMFSVLGVQARAQIWIGSLTTILFFLTLVDLLVHWRERAGAHADAVQRLGRLKGMFRMATIHDDRVVATGIDLSIEYDRTMEQLPPIPERLFLWMKAKHIRKVQVSKLLDTHAGAPLSYVYLLAYLEGVRGTGQADSEVKPEE
jgi:hypothetical protein